jgi:hypothetical protein
MHHNLHIPLYHLLALTYHVLHSRITYHVSQLYCTVLYCTVPCVLYCTVLYHVYCTVLHGPYCTVTYDVSSAVTHTPHARINTGRSARVHHTQELNTFTVRTYDRVCGALPNATTVRSCPCWHRYLVSAGTNSPHEQQPKSNTTGDIS